MTSASELFYQRRSRLGRPDTEFDPSSSHRHFHSGFTRRHFHHTHSRHDLDACDTIRRSSHVRNLCHRSSSISERASFRVDQSTSQPVHSNSINTEALGSTNRPRLTESDRLPGAVLLARARLVERLRGISQSTNRRSSRVSFDISNREHTSGDDLHVDAVDREAGWSARGTSTFSVSTNSAERLQLIQESYKKKPPGLSSEDINCLQLEIFSSSEKGEIGRLSRDCSICLESFTEGDKLIHLPCEHRFHSVCLDRWIRSCGDCPYCRRDIVVTCK
ncbi:RING/U-box superfamily protein [Euphorbia peplus]|nr:RING/U-box superfamily protein [Euphorbia peplus]